MAGPRDYYIKWSKSKTNVIWYHLYVKSKKCYKWTYLQNTNRITDIEDKFMVTKGDKFNRSLGVIYKHYYI